MFYFRISKKFCACSGLVDYDESVLKWMLIILIFEMLSGHCLYFSFFKKIRVT